MQILKCKICGERISKGSKFGLCKSCAMKEWWSKVPKKEYKCKGCGKQITTGSKSGLCNSCSAKERLKIPENNSMWGKTLTKEHREKIRQGNLGKKHTLESRNKISQARKGKPSNMLGKKHSQTTRDKMIKSAIKRYQDPKEREKMSLAFGGTGNPYENSKYPSIFSKALRKEIRQRDNSKCQCCGMTQEEHYKKYGRDIEIHHIDYNHANCEKTNLITTCKKCNSGANFNRDYHYAFYTYKMDIIYEK